MGLRFENDGNKPTNGPVLFFTGLSGVSPLAKAIDNALDKRLSFYAFKKPFEINATFGSTENITVGLDQPGFIIASFNSEIPFLNIPFRNITFQHFDYPLNYSQPPFSTSQREFEKEVEDILLKVGASDKEKIVAARVLNIDGEFGPGETFDSLCQKYPDAFVYCFSTPYSGCWIGASPELLLESSDGKFKTMALAGTLPEGKSSVDWDKKNQLEHDAVVYFIKNVFQNNGLNPNIGETQTRKAGNLFHLCTLIESRIPLTFNSSKLVNFIQNLSPTPAISGFPKGTAMDFISEHETFPRAFYGGFCGPFRSPNDFHFSVTIRGASFSAKKVSLYAGCGVRHGSVPIEEWNETQRKLDTLKSCLALEIPENSDFFDD